MKPAWFVALSLLCHGAQAAPAARDTNGATVRVLAINYDPVQSNGVRLSKAMKWKDPRPMTTNLLRYLGESSGGFARYQLVNFIDVDAFPQSVTASATTNRAFAKCGKTKRRRTSPMWSVAPQSSGKTTSSNGSNPKN